MSAKPARIVIRLARPAQAGGQADCKNSAKSSPNPPSLLPRRNIGTHSRVSSRESPLTSPAEIAGRLRPIIRVNDLLTGEKGRKMRIKLVALLAGAFGLAATTM